VRSESVVPPKKILSFLCVFRCISLHCLITISACEIVCSMMLYLLDYPIILQPQMLSGQDIH
jgi:hypothetical protein